MASRTEARRDRIAQLVTYREQMKVGELAEELGVSTETIRRDLDALERAGLVCREHGIARAGENQAGTIIDVRKGEHTALKQRIARAALELVHDRSTLYLDSGSTGLALAQLLGERRHLTVVTNGLEQALATTALGHRVIIPGGQIDPQDNASLGGITCKMLSSTRFDQAFIATDGLLDAGGPTAYKTDDFDLKQVVVTQSRRVVVLADASKFDRTGTFEFCRWAQVDTLITNELTPDQRASVAEVGRLVEV